MEEEEEVEEEGIRGGRTRATQGGGRRKRRTRTREWCGKCIPESPGDPLTTGNASLHWGPARARSDSSSSSSSLSSPLFVIANLAQRFGFARPPVLRNGK